MDYFENNIGKNIRKYRLDNGLSQEKMARKCNFSNTTLSAYENGKKTPGLRTTAEIAKTLNVSVEQLLYGDESKSFISSETNEGRKIVNAIYYLWDCGVISTESDGFEEFRNSLIMNSPGRKSQPLLLTVKRYQLQIARLISSLNQYRKDKSTYDDAEAYLEMILNSVANDINMKIAEQNKAYEDEVKRLSKNKNAK